MRLTHLEDICILADNIENKKPAGSLSRQKGDRKMLRVEQAEIRTDFCEADTSAGTLKPMEVYLHIDLNTHKTYIDTYYHIDGVPVEIWHGVVRRYRIQSDVDAVELTADINNGKFDEVLSRIIDGSDVVWDGDNWVGRLTDDGHDAEHDLEKILLEYSGDGMIGLWEAGDWFQGVDADFLGITSDTTDEQLKEKTKKEEKDALREGAVLVGTLEYLTELRDKGGK